MKSWYRSKTIWGAMIMLVSLILTSITGVQISEDEQGQAGDLVMNGIEAGLALFGFILTIIGRVKAKQAIGGGAAGAAKSMIIIFMASALLVGCAALDQTAYKTLYTSGRTYQATMSSANQLYMDGQIGQEQVLSIIDKSNYFYVAYQAACDALEIYLKTKSAESKQKLIAALDALSGKSGEIQSYVERLKNNIVIPQSLPVQ